MVARSAVVLVSSLIAALLLPGRPRDARNLPAGHGTLRARRRVRQCRSAPAPWSPVIPRKIPVRGARLGSTRRRRPTPRRDLQRPQAPARAARLIARCLLYTSDAADE